MRSCHFCPVIGIKESDTGLAAPSQWDLVSDKQMMQEEQPLQVLYFFIRFNKIFWILVSNLLNDFAA